MTDELKKIYVAIERYAAAQQTLNTAKALYLPTQAAFDVCERRTVELNKAIADHVAAAVANEFVRLFVNVGDLHATQTLNNQEFPRSWHEGVKAALNAMRGES